MNIAAPQQVQQQSQNIKAIQSVFSHTDKQSADSCGNPAHLYYNTCFVKGPDQFDVILLKDDMP